MLVRCKFTVQTRFSPCGNVIKDYFPGDTIILDKKVAEGTILFPGRESAVIIKTYEDIPEVSDQQEIDYRGPRPDEKDIEELINDDDVPENKQDKTPVDPSQDTDKIEVNSKLKKKK